MKWIRYFILSAGAILLAAALIRFVIAIDNAPALALSDPMFGIPLRDAIWVVGIFELAVALLCLFGKNTSFQIAALTWLVTNFFVVWISALSMGLHPQGTCIGGLTDPLYLLRGAPGFIIGIIPLLLLVGSYAAMVTFWSQRRLLQTVETTKMSCPACGIHIEFSVQYFGQNIPCPQCQAPITLRRPENLKMSCFACMEHIEFPSHALGRQIPCPHCKINITLMEQA